MMLDLEESISDRVFEQSLTRASKAATSSPEGEIRLMARTLSDEFAGIEGIAELRVLPRSRRHGVDRHKVFIVLGTHDIDRDRRIVELMSQFERTTFDLVPAARSHLIPHVARPAESFFGRSP